MTREHRATIIRWATLVLTVAAFAGSYRHGVTWVMAHTKHAQGESHPDVWMYLTAALPEVMVGLSVLKAQDNHRDPVAWVVGSSAVAWTLWANGSSAGHGLSGLIVALWPAWAALSALWLMGHAGGPEDVPVAQSEPPAVTRAKTATRVIRPKMTRVSDPFTPGHSELIAADLDPGQTAPGSPGEQDDLGRPEVKETAMTRGVRWVMAQESEPSVGEIMAHLGSSRKTASRVRVAAGAARAAKSEGGSE